MTQREHDEDLLAATEAAIEECATAIGAIAFIPEDRLREQDKIALGEYAGAKAELEWIRKDLMQRLGRVDFKFKGPVQMREAESGIKLPDLILPMGFTPSSVEEVEAEAQRLLCLPITMTTYDPLTGRVKMFI